jgi:putative effector of murein hydrolase
MATNVKILAAGVTSVAGPVDLYAPLSPRTALVSSILLEAGGATTVNLIAGVTGSLFNCNKVVFASAGTTPLTDPITLGVSEKIQIAMSPAVSVNFTVMGIERD